MKPLLQNWQGGDIYWHYCKNTIFCSGFGAQTQHAEVHDYSSQQMVGIRPSGIQIETGFIICCSSALFTKILLTHEKLQK